MRGDDSTKNIDVPAKVRAFRKDFPPAKAAIVTSFTVEDIAGVPAVTGHAEVRLLQTEGDTDFLLSEPLLLSEAYATRGLRPPVPGAQGMKDTRDAERAMTGAVGRALFLMGYGDKPDDSADYEEVDWFKDNGWRDQAHHDSFMEDGKLALKELVDPWRQQAIDEWRGRSLKWPLTYEQFSEWSAVLVPLAREQQKAHESQAGAGGAGDQVGQEPAPQPSLPPVEDSIGPDVPLLGVVKT